MTKAGFEADLLREGYETREGETKPKEHREVTLTGSMRAFSR